MRKQKVLTMTILALTVMINSMGNGVSAKAEEVYTDEAATEYTYSLEEGMDTGLEGMSGEIYEEGSFFEENLQTETGDGISLCTLGNNGNSGEIIPELQFKIYDLPYDKATQSFYVGTTYIYVTQTYEGTVYLSRCIKESEDTAIYQSHMTIVNAGHGTTLVPYYDSYKKKQYFLVCAKRKEQSNGKYSTIQIGRTEYVEGDIVNAKSLNRFSDIDCANKNFEAFGGELRRVTANLSTDKTTILFWAQDVNGKVQYSYYDFDLLNDIWNDGTKVISFSDTSLKKEIKEAYLSSYTQTKDNSLVPNGSFQGMDITNGNVLYLVSGNENEDNYYPLRLASMNGSGGNIKSYKVDMPSLNVGRTSGVKYPISGTIRLWELEGIQIINSDTIYIGAVAKDEKNIP